ncbi:MAG: IPExxxVDY family protein [Bacteroidia bacterium]|nr:IPExxxVDY family protein [Bacteroidia bacterium]
MAKHVLHSSDDDFDFVLIGITCPENQYRLVSEINDSLGITLFLSDYLPFNLKDGKIFQFSLYRFLDEELRLEYFFIPNTSNYNEPNPNSADDLFAGIDIDESVKLVKELPKTDYFLILKGEDLHNVRFKILECLKGIADIVQLQGIEPNELQSKRNLIF